MFPLFVGTDSLFVGFNCKYEATQQNQIRKKKCALTFHVGRFYVYSRFMFVCVYMGTHIHKHKSSISGIL
jgi:hypothetical protein